MQKVMKLYGEIRRNCPDLCSNWGRRKAFKNNILYVDHRENPNTQFLYGDVSDWIRDYHSDLSLKERDMLATLIIGDYVIKKRLL